MYGTLLKILIDVIFGLECSRCNQHKSNMSNKANEQLVALVVETKVSLSLGDSQTGKTRYLQCFARGKNPVSLVSCE